MRDFRYMNYAFIIGLLGFLLCSAELSGQRYVRGSIEKTDGTVTDGFVRKTNKEDQARLVTFKPRRAAIQITYLPGEIAGYSMRRTDFEFVEIPVSLTFSRKVFAINLVDGLNKLYRYRNPNGDWSYIFVGAMGKVVELKPDQYTNQLSEIMVGCPAIEKRIERAGYGKCSLKRLTKRYNGCFEQ